jgi:hypothetical protein
MRGAVGWRRKRPDWALLLGWTGIAIALCILLWFLLAVR